jgi:hypothetical protein
MITKVYYRTTENECNYDGSDSHSFFGEASISLEQVHEGKLVDRIEYGTLYGGAIEVINIWKKNGAIPFMVIPFNMVCRIIND